MNIANFISWTMVNSQSFRSSQDLWFKPTVLLWCYYSVTVMLLLVTYYSVNHSNQFHRLLDVVRNVKTVGKFTSVFLLWSQDHKSLRSKSIKTMKLIQCVVVFYKFNEFSRQFSDSLSITRSLSFSLWQDFELNINSKILSQKKLVRIQQVGRQRNKNKTESLAIGNQFWPSFLFIPTIANTVLLNRANINALLQIKTRFK